MQLVLRRSQKSSGLLSKSVVFCLDARVDLKSEERANVDKYRLGGQVLYNSEASKRHLDEGRAAMDSGGAGGWLKATAKLAMAKLSLNISVDSLTKGHHIECKDLDELLGAEEAIKTACENIKAYLQVATTFDGRETVVDLDEMAAA